MIYYINGDSHFTYNEFIKSDTALRKGIDNKPNGDQINNIGKLVDRVLEPTRDKFGPIRITSGFRTPELCLAIGSSPTSNHTRGEAADIEPVNCHIQLIDVLEWIYNNCEFRELIAEYFPLGWIHVAYREGANVKKLKLKDKDHNYKVVSLDYIKNIY